MKFRFFGKHNIKRIGLVALPIVLFLIIYWWWNPSLTRSDRRFRKQSSKVVEVQVHRETWSRIEDVENTYHLVPSNTHLLTLNGQKLQDFIGKLRVKDVNIYPGWGYAKDYPGPFMGPVTSPHVYLLFIVSDQNNFRLDVYRGWFVLIRSGMYPPGPWENNGAPLQESTKAYLKELLKPYNIPDEVIDGQGK